jgi:hypothetical protein
MRNTAIALLSMEAAKMTGTIGDMAKDAEELGQTLELYAYCRARKFPPAEQLARRASEIAGHEFNLEQWNAEAELRTSFEVFRAVAKALEPFHEADPAPTEKPQAEKGKAESKAKSSGKA